MENMIIYAKPINKYWQHYKSNKDLGLWDWTKLSVMNCAWPFRATLGLRNPSWHCIHGNPAFHTFCSAGVCALLERRKKQEATTKKNTSSNIRSKNTGCNVVLTKNKNAAEPFQHQTVHCYSIYRKKSALGHGHIKLPIVARKLLF